MELQLIKDRCLRDPFVLETFRDKSGTVGLCVLIGNSFSFLLDKEAELFAESILSSTQPLVCFEFRKLAESFPRLLQSRIHDVKLLYDGEESLFRCGKDVLGEKEVFELQARDNQFKVHMRACKAAKMNMDLHSVLRLMPVRLVLNLCKIRAQVAYSLWSCKRADDLDRYERDDWRYAKALYEVEKNGIRIDVPFAKAQLKVSHGAAADKMFRSMVESNRDGFVYSRFSPVGGKTGRVRVESGFQSMSVPHGPNRQAIISRYQGGKIFAFDFNAIDYRCIVSSINDEEFRNKYKGVKDFHARTTSFLFGDEIDELRRDVVKKITYVYIYGGSHDAVAQKTGLTIIKLNHVIERLDSKIGPIKKFRNELCAAARKNGYVTPPGGRPIPIENGFHDGKILGLYAQSFSSVIFREAFLRVCDFLNGKRSKIIFTVHDELVVDMHPTEFHLAEDIQKIMEGCEREFVVKYKEGKNYAEATE